MATRPGTYSLRLDLPEYAPVTIAVAMTAEDTIKTVNVALERGATQLIQFALASGAPAGNAMILEGALPGRANPQYMSTVAPTGEFSLRGRPGETRVLFIVPGEGSFSALRVVLPREPGARPLRVVVPNATATLRVRGMRNVRPVPAALLLRYNGEFVPAAVLRLLTQDIAGTSRDGEAVIQRLPAGMYEVWELAGPGDEEQLIASGGTLRAPARVGLATGEGVVNVVAPSRER